MSLQTLLRISPAIMLAGLIICMFVLIVRDDVKRRKREEK